MNGVDRMADIIMRGLMEADVAKDLTDELYMLRSDRLDETCMNIARSIHDARKERKARKHHG